MLIVVVFYGFLWQETTFRTEGMLAITRASGRDAAVMLRGLFPFGPLPSRLDAAMAKFPDDARLEPEIAAHIGNAPVASLSSNFTNLAAAGLQITLYPTLQRFAGYTPHLDAWNAAWVREKGPRFLVFDGDDIDERDPWSDTPAMWLEIYRLYDTRKLGPNNLLLERRASPRFEALESIRRTRMNLLGEVRIPPSSVPVFWSLDCGYSAQGKVMKALARVPGTSIVVHTNDGATRSARVIPDLLGAPVMGTYLPADLEQFAAVFQAEGTPKFSVDRISFEGRGRMAYSDTCEMELLRPAPAAAIPFKAAR